MRQVYRLLNDGETEILLAGDPGNSCRNNYRLKRVPKEVLGLMRDWPVLKRLTMEGQHPLTRYLPQTMLLPDEVWICYACGKCLDDPNSEPCDMRNLPDDLRDELVALMHVRRISL